MNAPPDPLNSSDIPFGASITHVAVIRLKRRLDADIQAVVAKHSPLSVPEWRILSVLSQNKEGMPQKEVIQRIAIAQGQASRAMFSLQQKGLVMAQQSDADRRSWNHIISEAGKDVLDKLLPHMQQRRLALDGAVSTVELEQFLETANKIAMIAERRKGDVRENSTSQK